MTVVWLLNSTIAGNAGFAIGGVIALYRVAVVIGYMSDRHLLLLTMIACFWAAASGLGRRTSL